MKLTTLILALLLSPNLISGQNIPKEYFELVKIADSLYTSKDYYDSAYKYSDAFKVIGWKVSSNDRYNAACSWALAAVPDSAFFQLEKIVAISNYTDYKYITTDSDLNTLHNDKRWEPLLQKITQNKDNTEKKLNKPLVAMLDTIYVEDQKYRQQIDGIAKKYGWESKEIKDHWKIINEKDSINLIKIKIILDKLGWLGSDVVGEQGNTTLFLVIQHSNIETQIKYLPMIREAVNNGKAQGSSLALLVDRVALRQGKRQIYGSQIGRDAETQSFYVLPLDDPDNVDIRRATVGLEPLAYYINHWQIKWDIEQYKKDLPKLEEKTKKKQKATNP